MNLTYDELCLIQDGLLEELHLLGIDMPEYKECLTLYRKVSKEIQERIHENEQTKE